MTQHATETSRSFRSGSRVRGNPSLLCLTLQVFLENGATVNAVTDGEHTTPLHQAIKYRRPEIVEVNALDPVSVA